METPLKNRWKSAALACPLVLACGGVQTPAEDDVVPPPAIVRQTCADNPLLAECATTSPIPGSDPTTDPTGPSPPAAVPPASELALARAAAENVLRVNCGQCHGPALTTATARAGMNYIDNVDELVANGKMTPLASEDSPIVQRMRDGSMPPVGSSGPRPSARDIDQVAEFIDNPVFWPDYRPAASCAGQLFAFDDLYADVQSDLRQAASDDRPFLRYVTLTNRYNAGACADTLDRERFAIGKLVNMLSPRATVASPVAVDRQELIYRIDLRDYDWDRTIRVDGRDFPDAWEAIIAASPYAVPFVGDRADDLRDDTLTDVPILNADAMLDAAALGNLYYALIGVDVDQPLSVFIRDRLGVDVLDDIQSGDAVRAGTTRSQITRQDRVLERHELGVRQGAFWQSFDFDPGAAGQSIFNNPFSFEPGGTEVIFTLPNGLLGFIIANRDDTIVTESDILLDTFQDDFVARTSVSCSNCHAQGFNGAVDEVGPYVQANRLSLQRDDVEAVAENYPSAADFARIIESDTQNYLLALRRANLPATGSDPIAASYVRFNLDLDLAGAAGELGVTPDELRRNLNLLDPALAILNGLTMDRDDFSAVFEASLCRLQLISENHPDPARCEAALAARN